MSCTYPMKSAIMFKKEEEQSLILYPILKLMASFSLIISTT